MCLCQVKINGALLAIRMEHDSGQSNDGKISASAHTHSLTIESEHNYRDNTNYRGSVTFDERIASLSVTFDALCRTEDGCDTIKFYKSLDDMERNRNAIKNCNGSSRWASFAVQGNQMFYRYSWSRRRRACQFIATILLPC